MHCRRPKPYQLTKTASLTPKLTMKLSINAHYAAPALALALSLPLMNIKNVATVFVGGMGAAGSVGYLGSMLLTADDRKKQQQALAKQGQQLASKEHELSTRFKTASSDLQQKLQQAIADRDRTAAASKAQVEAIESQRSHLLSEAKAAMGAEMRREFEALYEGKYQQKVADYDRRESEFYHAEGELCDQIEALQILTDQQEDYLKEEFFKATSAKNEKFKASYQDLMGEVEKYGEVIQMTSSEAMAEIQRRISSLLSCEAKLNYWQRPKNTGATRRMTPQPIRF